MPDRKMSQSFGYKIAWFALRTIDTGSVVQAFGLKEPIAVDWAIGIAATYKEQVFVTPPVNGWTLLPAWHWVSLLDENPSRVIGPWLRRLSKQFGEVQFFASYRVAEYHLWARARSGRLVRAYGYFGERAESVWDAGRQTPAELDAGLFGFDDQQPPNEESVMQVAGRWSVNPCELDDRLLGPGVLCFP